MTGVAAADPPADAPVVLRVVDGQLRTPDGVVHQVGPGTYLDDAAAANVAQGCARSEAEAETCVEVVETQPPDAPVALIAVLVAGAFAAGVAVAKLLPAR